jgi:hypothetical protein
MRQWYTNASRSYPARWWQQNIPRGDTRRRLEASSDLLSMHLSNVSKRVSFVFAAISYFTQSLSNLLTGQEVYPIITTGRSSHNRSNMPKPYRLPNVMSKQAQPSLPLVQSLISSPVCRPAEPTIATFRRDKGRHFSSCAHSLADQMLRTR